MKINADFSRPAMLVPQDDDWVCSPESGVDRIMLDRIGDEVARATSIVRYAPRSSFKRHEHAMGEEFLVVEGIFSDEHADYGTGTYVRNPPGSGHSPHSEKGCRILVKLRQFEAEDLKHVVVDTTDARLWQQDNGNPARLKLHQYGTEVVQMIRLATGEEFVTPNDGSEIFVVGGSFAVDDIAFPVESWLRFPTGKEKSLKATADSVLWLKNGHLPATPD